MFKNNLGKISRNALTAGLILMLPVFFSAAQKPAREQSKHKTPSAIAGSIKVDGLSCPFCSFGLSKKLRKLPWIKNVKVYVDEGRADFTVKDKEAPNLTALKKAVKKGGFTPRKILFNVHGTVENTDKGAFLNVYPYLRFSLKAGKLLDKLVGELGLGALVQIQGSAEGEESRIRLKVLSYKVL